LLSPLRGWGYNVITGGVDETKPLLAPPLLPEFGVGVML